MSTELQPEERLLAAMVRLAIKDAQASNVRVREDAARWLWWVAPSVAERACISKQSFD